jgi:hypothetical protein
MNIFKLVDRPNKALSNILLFVFTFIFIFLTPLFPDNWTFITNNVLFSVLFFTGIYALEKVRKRIIYFAIIAFITQWITLIFNIRELIVVSEITNIIFFQIIIIRLIIQVAKNKEVSTDVIFESINGYLLMGIMFSSWIAILINFRPDAFNGFDPVNVNFQDIFYFTFVTLTTLGYGEITPQIPLAKSLSILISTCGQLYIAIIIAMLVGKFAGSQQNKVD